MKNTHGRQIHIRATLALTVAATAGVLAACDAQHQPVAASASAAAASAYAPAAEIFSPGVISDARWQWRITLSPDGKTAYFSESEGFFPFTRQATIYVSRQVDGEWTTPEVAPFSGRYSDMDPFLSPNGQRLYFSSVRPVDGVPRRDLDIWYVERTASGWSEPVNAGAAVNGPVDELYPSADARGDLYYAVGPFGPTAAMDFDIYRAARAGDGFAPREALTDINTDLPYAPTNPTADWEFNPEISIDGRTLVFASLRPGGYGYGDLYVSHLHQGAWSAPVNMGPAVNTAWDEYHPTFSRDRRHLYFVRALPGTTRTGDFYRIETRGLDALDHASAR